MFIWACFPFHSKITVGEGEEIYHSTKDARVMWPKEEKNEWGQKSLTTAAKSCEELGTLNWTYDLRSIILWEMSTADNRGMTMRCICVCVCLCVCVCVCVCVCACVCVHVVTARRSDDEATSGLYAVGKSKKAPRISWLSLLDATTHLHKRSCPTVGPSVRPSVRWSVGPSRVIFERQKTLFLRVKILSMSS